MTENMSGLSDFTTMLDPTDKAIVVSTWSGGEDWANQLLMSINGVEFPVVVVINDATNANRKWIDHLIKHCAHVIGLEGDHYEIGAMQAVYEQLPHINEFFLLQDSMVVKDQTMFYKAFGWVDRSVSYAQNTYECYAGKWRRKILAGVPFPSVANKKEAIFWEHIYPSQYFLADDKPIIALDSQWSNTNPQNELVEVLGEERLRIHGLYLDKYKSVSRESSNIPMYWNDEQYEGFLDSWRKK